MSFTCQGLPNNILYVINKTKHFIAGFHSNNTVNIVFISKECEFSYEKFHNVEFMMQWRPLVVILRNNRSLLQVGIDLIQRL